MHLNPPDVLPGMVTLQYVGPDSPESGEKKDHYINVFPVDARELVGTGKYKLVDNGAAEVARLNSAPLRSRPTATASTVTPAPAPAPAAEPAPAPEAPKPAATATNPARK